MGRCLSLLGLFAVAAGMLALATTSRQPRIEAPKEEPQEAPANPRFLVFPQTASFHTAFSLN
jgi:hypothetical protein